jgi:broad specificity phosphatase PhoE
MDNDKTTTLYLMRHGETEDNVSRVIQGHNDSPLTQEGIAATRGRAKMLKGIMFDAIFCSDLERTRKSLGTLLEELDLNIDVTYCADIREIDFGQLSGKKVEEIKDIILLHKEQTLRHYTDGESGYSFGKRVLSFVKMVLDVHGGGTILFMTHFGVIETILKHYIGKQDDKLNTKNYDMGLLYFDKKGVNYKWI